MEIYEVRFTNKTTGEDYTDFTTKNKEEALAHKDSLKLLGYKNPHIKHTFKNGGKAKEQKKLYENIVEERQQRKAKQLRDALIKEGFYVGNPNTSITDFGVSTYISFDDKFDQHRKFRISDHSVTNFDRVFGEYHYNEESDINEIIKKVKKDIEDFGKLTSERKKLFDLDNTRTIKANKKWDEIKPKFQGLCFKINHRTYQTIEEFSKNKNRTNIYQKFIGKNRFGENAYYYEWTEPKNECEFCELNPSRDFIENYINNEKEYGGKITIKAENGMKTPSKFEIGYRPGFLKGNVVLGKEITIKLPNGETPKGRFAIVELNDVLASHNEHTFNSTIGYPLDSNGQNINDRNYQQDQNAQAKVKEFAQDLQPDRLISTSRTPSGTPVISIDGIVLSGNNRTMSIKLAQQQFPEKYAEYIDFLIEEIQAYGFYGAGKTKSGNGIYVNYDMGAKQFENPLLVRIDYDVKEYNTMELAKWNKDTKKSEKPIDKAIKLGKILLGSERCQNIISDVVGQYETFTEFYSNLADQKRIKDTLIDCNILTTQEIPAYFYERGFTDQGKELIENLLAGMVLSQEGLVASNEGGARAFRQTIITSLPVLTQNIALGDDSLKKELNEALLLQAKMTNNKLSFFDLLAQTNIFDEKPSKWGVYINRLLASGRNKFKGAIEGYNASILNSNEANLFGDKPTKEEIFDTFIASKIDTQERQAIEQAYPNEQAMPKSNTIEIKEMETPKIIYVDKSKETINTTKNMQQNNLNPFVNGEFFVEHPEKILAKTEQGENWRTKATITIYKGSIADVERIDADENFVTADLESDPNISVVKQSVKNATDTDTEVVDNLTRAINVSRIDESKKALRKVKKSKPTLEHKEAQHDNDIIGLAENFAKLSPNVPMEDVMAFLIYQKERGREVTNKEWITMTGLNTDDLYSADLRRKLVESGHLYYFNGGYLPSYLYFAENIYDKQMRLVPATETAQGSGQDKDYIIENYGLETYNNQVEKLALAFHKQYEKRLLIKGDNKEGLMIIPISDFAKKFKIKTSPRTFQR